MLSDEQRAAIERVRNEVAWHEQIGHGEQADRFAQDLVHLLNAFDSHALKLDQLQESYEACCRHGDRGWEFLKVAVGALYKLACYGESQFYDEPASVKVARAALQELPSAGAYEGMLPKEEPKP